MNAGSTAQISQRLPSRRPHLRPSQIEILLLILNILAFISIEIRADVLRPFWFDELSTMLVASRSSLQEMLRAVPADGNPPLYFLLARPFLSLPISTELALRIPSLVAINISAVATYLLLRRQTDSTCAFVGTSVFLATPMTRFAALEARPYSLLLCFTSLALLCWQSAIDGTHRRLALIGISSGMAGAILSHHYGVLYVSFPILAGELVRIWQSRKVDVPVLLALLLGAATLLITFPPMLRGQAGLLHAVKASSDFWARPSWHDLQFYRMVFPPFILPFLLITGVLGAVLGVFIYRRPCKFHRNSEQSGRDVWAAALVLLLMLPIMLLVSEAGTRYFVPRYAVGSALGVGIVSGLLCSRLRDRFSYLAPYFAAAVVYCFTLAALGLWIDGPRQPIAGLQSDQLLLSAPEGQPIVMADALRFLPTWWYSNSQVRSRLHYVGDLNYAIRQPDFLPEYSLALEQPYGAPRIDDYKSFGDSHGQFLLYCSGSSDLEWIKGRLQRDGWHLVPIGSEGSHRLYQVTRAISH